MSERMAAGYEAKNVAARERLDPLEENERPLVVTIGALIAGAIALAVVIAYLAGAKVNGERPAVVQVITPAFLMGMASYGMWRARYWAVLGFEVVLAFLIFAAAIGIVAATSILQVAGNLLLIAVAGALFFFMIKAMARIQMPERPSRPPL
jgi:peptidoglycan/LPS O-acetylase OafA/YrhL